jgi:hypothetical protein
MLGTMPHHAEFIFSSARKRPYQRAGTLGCAIGRHLDKLKIEGYSMHGLRENAGMELAMAGCSVPESWRGWAINRRKMAIFYVKQAEKKSLARNATVKWGVHIDEHKAKRTAQRRHGIKRVK